MPFSKRLFDLTFAFLALIILFPIIFVTAIHVRIFIGTPILFKQQRPGYKGHPFFIYKFRSMTNHQTRNGDLLPDAERLTRFGRLLRSLSLDELPELFNIVRGSALREQPEIWANFASYDWVALCQIWGRMIDLPSGMPMFCMDLMQDLRQRGIKRSELPKQDPATEHSAIEDARWLRKAHRFAQGLNWE
jgi:hypothetical protein